MISQVKGGVEGEIIMKKTSNMDDIP